MTALLAGAVVDRLPGPKYSGALRFTEIELRAPLPRAGTLTQWRKRVGPAMACGLVAPAEATASKKAPLRMDDELGQSLDWLAQAAEALDATYLVVRTSANLTPSTRDRATLGTYFEALRKRTGRRLVWSPAGLWEMPEALDVAGRLGVDVGFDPLESPPAAAAFGSRSRMMFCRIRAIGVRSRVSEGTLQQLQDTLTPLGLERCFVAIESPTSFRDAVRLQTLIDGAATAAG